MQPASFSTASWRLGLLLTPMIINAREKRSHDRRPDRKCPPPRGRALHEQSKRGQRRANHQTAVGRESAAVKRAQLVEPLVIVRPVRLPYALGAQHAAQQRRGRIDDERQKYKQREPAGP